MRRLWPILLFFALSCDLTIAPEEPNDAPLLSDQPVAEHGSPFQNRVRLVPAGHIERGPPLVTVRAGGTAPMIAFDCLVVTWGADPDGVTIRLNP